MHAKRLGKIDSIVYLLVFSIAVFLVVGNYIQDNNYAVGKLSNLEYAKTLYATTSNGFATFDLTLLDQDEQDSLVVFILTDPVSLRKQTTAKTSMEILKEVQQGGAHND